MKSVMSVIFLLSLTWGQTSPDYDIQSKKNSRIILKNASIVVSAQKTIAKGSILIDKGIILEVSEQDIQDKKASVIDLKGKFIYPGFIDLFTSYGLPELKNPPRQDGPVYLNKRSGMNAWNGAIQAENLAALTFKPNENSAKSWLESGFTVVQSASKDGIFRGQAFITLLNNQLSNDAIMNKQSMHYLSFDKGISEQWYPSSLMGAIALMRQTFLDADWYTLAHSAYEKNPMQVKPEFNASLAALKNYRSEKFLFQSNSILNHFQFDKIRKEFKLNVILSGSGDEYLRINELAKTGLKFVMNTEFAQAPSLRSPEDIHEASLEELRHWERSPSNLIEMDKHGIRFALSPFNMKNKTDFWKNLRTVVQRGLKESTAIAALTTIPAEFLGISEQVGTIQSGKMANFVISNKRIFDKDAKIESVYILGEINEINPSDMEDFKGEYQLSFNKNKLKMFVTVNEKLNVVIQRDSLKINTENASIEFGRLQFSFKGDSLGLSGKQFISLSKKANQLEGYLLTANLERTYLMADYLGSVKEDIKKKSDIHSDSILSKLTFPNKSFGLNEIPKQENVIFKNATIWTSENEGILKETDLWVFNGKIKAIGKNLKGDKNTIVIRADNIHLTAGIIDEHSHIAIDGAVNELAESSSAEVRIADVLDPFDINIYRQLSGGVVISQLLHGSGNPIGGQAQVIKLRWGAMPDDLKFAQAPASIKFALGENVKHSNFGDNYTIRYPQTRMGVESFMKDIFVRAQEYQTAWKKYDALSLAQKQVTIAPRKDLDLEAISDVLASKMFVHCHSYVQSEILSLIRLAESFNFKIQTFTHILEGYKVADEMAKHGSMASSFADWWAYKFEVYDAIPHNAGLLTQKNVITSINSDDAEMARRLNQEAAKSIFYTGMSEEDAWKMVTIHPAKQLKIEKYTGSIKVGKDADLVLWNNNPLSVYAKALMTFVDGRRYFDRERDKELRQLQKIEKENLVQKILNNGNKVDMKKNSVKQLKPEKHCDDNHHIENEYNETKGAF